MGWDYDARLGDANYHLTLWWGGRLSAALAAFGAFDWDAEPPEAPASIWAERADDDPWPDGVVRLTRSLEPDHAETLGRVLDEFGAFCRAAGHQGGFWAY